MQLKPGTLLQGGKYRIEKVLGQGGFGITYRAYDMSMETDVAIKEFFMKDFCNRSADDSSVSVPSLGSVEMVDRYRSKFLLEARRLFKFNHRNIVRVFSVFEENGTAYYVMEYLSGGSLKDRILQGGLPEPDALNYIHQVCDALSYIHDKGIAHLDVKPANIMFRDDKDIVLIDFGISKHYDESGGQTSSTPVGVSEGYTPVEQYRQGGVSRFSASTDIYSLGATLYKLLSGVTPLGATTRASGESLEPLPSCISPAVCHAISMAMEIDKAMRPQSVEAFLDLLDTPVVTVSDEETKTVDSSSEKSDSSSSGNSETSGSSSGSYDHNKPYIKKWLWPLLTGFAVVAVVLLAVFRPFEPDALSSDLFAYKEYLHQGDSLSMHEESLSEAISAYDSASAYEQKYSGSRYSRRFRGVASSKSASVQSRIDSIRVSDSLAKVAAAEAAAARAELERQEQERKQREAYERLKRSSSYNNGVLKVGSVEYPMVYVSGGSFDMGATPEQGSDADDDEKPVHRVTLSSYSIGKYEVTQDLWEAVMGSNPSYDKGSRRPVEQVSWNDCQDFIRKLNELTGANFRLPTEAEWEFAARGGNSSRGYKYSGSNTLDEVAWYIKNSGSETHDVGTKSLNELGLYDMSGNVYEWGNDYYGSYSSSSQTNPKGPKQGSYRVCRGGCWYRFARYCRVSFRFSSTPDDRYFHIGLRLCH